VENKKIGIGIIGLGGRGVHFGGELFSKFPDCRIVGLHDISQYKINEARKILGDIPGTTSIDEFLAIPGMDAVIICSSPAAHAKNCLDVLSAKKHVYVEKPMATTIEDCDAMIDAWNGTNVVFMVGLELRYCTLMQDMKKIIESGEIGDIKIGTVIDNVSVGGRYYYHDRHRRRKETMKTILLEKGTHSLDLANWLVDSSPRKVYYSGALDVYGGNEPNDKRCRYCDKKDECPFYLDYKGFRHPNIVQKDDLCVFAQECDVHDNSLVIIDYDNGARICYMECHFTPEYSREFMFVGDKGKIYGFYNNEQEFKITVWKRHTRKIEMYIPERSSGGHGGGDERIAREFIEKVKAGKPSISGVLGARDSAAIAIAAVKSSETGMPVIIPEKKILAGYER